MKLSTIIEGLELEIVTGETGIRNIEVDGVYIGDLLSLVMAKAKHDEIWITIQTHINVVAIADLLDLGAILVAENMEIDEDTMEKAANMDIVILKSKLSAYELACRLHDLGM